jgi:pimeloyl-ACP methyl ester carboxylesterase
VAVVHGSADAAFSPDIARATVNMVPYCVGLTMILGGPHAAALTHPQEVAGAVRTFVQGLSG